MKSISTYHSIQDLIDQFVKTAETEIKDKVRDKIGSLVQKITAEVAEEMAVNIQVTLRQHINSNHIGIEVSLKK